MYYESITSKITIESLISIHFATLGEDNSYNPKPTKAIIGTVDKGLKNLVTL